MNIGKDDVGVWNFAKSIATRQLNEAYVGAKRDQISLILR